MLNWEYAPLNYEGELMPLETDILLLKAEEQITIPPPTPHPLVLEYSLIILIWYLSQKSQKLPFSESQNAVTLEIYQTIYSPFRSFTSISR